MTRYSNFSHSVSQRTYAAHIPTAGELCFGLGLRLAVIAIAIALSTFL